MTTISEVHQRITARIRTLDTGDLGLEDSLELPFGHTVAVIYDTLGGRGGLALLGSAIRDILLYDMLNKIGVSVREGEVKTPIYGPQSSLQGLREETILWADL